MKNAPAVANVIRTKHNVTALPKATIEWNMNRYFEPTVSNTPSEISEGNDVDIFPLESIVESWRPTKGIAKARIGQGYIASKYTDSTARFYLGSEKDKYKYWQSPYISDSAGALSGCVPQVIYAEKFRANKIRAVVENTWASPADFTLQYTNDSGATWTSVGVPLTVQNNGVIEAYWNGTAWTGTKPAGLSATLEMNGVRFVCTRLSGGKLSDGSPTITRVNSNYVATTGASSYLSLIELAPCLVRDISEVIVSAEDTFDAGESNVVTPVGRLTTNTGSITIWNEKNQFSTESSDPTYNRLIEQNAEVNLSYVFNVDGGTQEVQQFKLYVDDWIDNNDGTVSLELSDASKHLSEIKPNAAKYENMRFTEIMYRLLDSVGWNHYRVSLTNQARDLVVPIYWTDGEQTMWEILEDLAETSQSVVFFDEYGVLNVRTREDAFSPTAAPVWTLRGQTSGTELADIETIEDDGEYGSNTVKIIYKNTHWADMNNGFAQNVPVWEAEDPTVLRSSALTKTLTEGERDRFQMSGFEASTWPHQGQCLIEGEVIEYDAKMFVYQDKGKFNWTWVTSQAEHDDFNSRVESAARHRNYYDGQFRIKERGQWNTAIKRHAVDIEGYSVTRYTKDGTRNGGGFSHDRRKSLANLRTTGLHDGSNEIMHVTRGVPGDSPWRYIGTKLVFHSGTARHQAAGIVWNIQGGKDGYYVEVCPTSQINSKDREVRNELIFFVIKNGNRSPNFPVKGEIAPVALDSWGELDIWTGYPSHRVAIWYRGKKTFELNVPEAWRLNPSGKFGMYARGSTDASFDYLYASSRAADPEPEADYSSLHVIEGVNTGRTFAEEWKHRNTKRERRKRKKTNKSIFDTNQRFMDEFGPYVHEYKEFDVKFDPAPVLSSFLFNTNEWASYLIDYRGGSFGANFTLVNTERHHAILSGQDLLSVPGDEEGVTQQLVAFGRPLIVEEGEEIVVKNDQQVRARGEIVTEIDSNWIQSKEAAKVIADWIVNHWSKGADQLVATIFGNPLLHIGDVVAVDYIEKNMTAANHQYFITGVSTSFDSGLSTTVTLRRRN